MLTADELQRLHDTWPDLPTAADPLVPIPPVDSGYARAVAGTPLEIVYGTSERGLHIWCIRQRS